MFSNILKNNYSENVKQKFLFYEEFWKGTGPFPILFAKPHFAKSRNYIKYNLVEQHKNAHKLLEESLLAVESYLDLIDDGIPVVRSDLGTTLLPSGLGLEVIVQPELHPWLKNHLTSDEVQNLPDPLEIQDIKKNEIVLAERFYHLFLQQKADTTINPDIFPYIPDTEGVFDLSHLLIGTNIFLLFYDNPDVMHKIQMKSLELFLAGTFLFKSLLGESKHSMLHGHGMPVGAWFPDTGARISEDSCTLISEEMIRTFCLPYIKKAVEPFQRGFMHYCGKHDGFLKMVCDMGEISTLNLGNPEMHDLDHLFSLLGKTKTVYLGHLEVLTDEDGETYLERMAHYCGKYRAKLILVSGYQPKDRDEKEKLVKRWHKLTERYRVK